MVSDCRYPPHNSTAIYVATQYSSFCAFIYLKPFLFFLDYLLHVPYHYHWVAHLNAYQRCLTTRQSKRTPCRGSPKKQAEHDAAEASNSKPRGGSSAGAVAAGEAGRLRQRRVCPLGRCDRRRARFRYRPERQGAGNKPCQLFDKSCKQVSSCPQRLYLATAGRGGM